MTRSREQEHFEFLEISLSQWTCVKTTIWLICMSCIQTGSILIGCYYHLALLWLSITHIQWASPIAQLVKNLPAMRETWVWSLGWEIPWRRERLPTPVFWPGESHGLCSLGSRKESDMTEWLSLHFIFNGLLNMPNITHFPCC